MDDYQTYARGDAAMLAAQLLLAASLTEEQRSVALGRLLPLHDELLRRGWSYVDEYRLDDPDLAVFFSLHVDSTDGYSSHSIHWRCYPAEGTISIRGDVDEPGYVDLPPKAWFMVDDAEGLAEALDAVADLEYKDELPPACYQHGAIVEWGDALYETTLSADQVHERRRRGPASTPADEVLDALRDVYDTCPKCGTYTGGQPHGCP